MSKLLCSLLLSLSVLSAPAWSAPAGDIRQTVFDIAPRLTQPSAEILITGRIDAGKVRSIRYRGTGFKVALMLFAASFTADGQKSLLRCIVQDRIDINA